MFEGQFCLGPSEEFCVLRIRAGPAALDETHTELVEQLRDRKFVGDGEVDAFALSAVTQGRVEYVETVVQHVGTPGSGLCHLVADPLPPTKKTSRGHERSARWRGPFQPARLTIMIA